MILSKPVIQRFGRPIVPRTNFFIDQRLKYASFARSTPQVVWRDHTYVAPWKTNRIYRSFADEPSKRFMEVQDLKKGRLPPKHFMSKDAQGNTRATGSDIAKVELKVHEDEAWLSETRANLPHPVWSEKAVRSVVRTHFVPHSWQDKLAHSAVRFFRTIYDLVSGYSLGFQAEKNWINRIIFLETIAGVPGLVGAMVRHLRSLRQMERDYGWIHTLLEEAENERMHLMSALQIRKPGFFFRLMVLGGQAFFLPLFTVAYCVSPKFAHRFVGYLEEEAVKTYSHLIEDLEDGQHPGFQKLQAPQIAKEYWELSATATFKDMIYAIRADESHHRDVNHTFASMNPDDPNPFEPGH